MKSRYEALDTSNPYANVTNTFEDLTVNTQAAEFAQQQAEQGRADILGNLAASAGGCLLYTSPSPRDGLLSRMPSSA